MHWLLHACTRPLYRKTHTLYKGGYYQYKYQTQPFLSLHDDYISFFLFIYFGKATNKKVQLHPSLSLTNPFFFLLCLLIPFHIFVKFKFGIIASYIRATQRYTIHPFHLPFYLLFFYSTFYPLHFRNETVKRNRKTEK